MKPSDDELLELARHALTPRRSDPPSDFLAALHRTVTERFSEPGRRSAWKVRLVTAGALVAVAASGSAAAAAAGAVLPTPLRAVAHGLGFPVDSVALAQTKADAARLREALRGPDGPTIRLDVAGLEASFDRLDGTDQRAIKSEVDDLLDEAAGIGSTDDRNAAPLGSGSGYGGSDVDRAGDQDGGPASSITVPDGLAPTISGGRADHDGGQPASPTTVPSGEQVTNGAGGSGPSGSDGEGSPTQTTTTTTQSGGSQPSTPTTVATVGGSGGGNDGGGGSDGGSTGQSGSDGGG